jgi:hypothetical protein
MNDSELDGFLRRLAEHPAASEAGSGFREGVWQRIGQMSEARDQRRRTILGLAIFAVALGTGVGATQTPAHAQRSAPAFADVTDLSPAALLHVSP